MVFNSLNGYRENVPRPQGIGYTPGEGRQTDASVTSNHHDGDALSLQDEATLVERARTDGTAFGELYQRYAKAIYNYVYYRTGNHHDAEDLTARTFQQALAHIGSYQDRGLPFSAWLYRIAHNLVVNWHRDRKRRDIVPLDDVVIGTLHSEAPEYLTEREEERDLLLRAMRNLSEERQQLLILKFVEHLSNAEIGAIMGRSEGAVKSLYHRTLIALREEVQRLTHPEERPPRRGRRRRRE